MKKQLERVGSKKRIFNNIRVILAAVILLAAVTNCSTHKEDIQLAGDQWSFLVFGDIRMGYGVYSKLVMSMATITPTPVVAICGGDVMNHGSNEVEWKAFWEYSEPITKKMDLHITRGNHEGNSKGDSKIFREQLKVATDNGDKFYYSFQKKNAYFIILDTEVEGEEEGIFNEQLEWLKNELDAAGQLEVVDHIFLSLHRPLFPQGGHYGQDMINALELHDLFLQHQKITAVLVSHDHVYNTYYRDGIPYVTSGGAGGPLHHSRGGNYHHYIIISIDEKNENVVNLKTIGLFNEIIEDFNL